MTAFPYESSEPMGGDTTLGVIVLQADETIEQEFRQIFPQPNLRIFTSRVPSGTEVTQDTLAEMSATLPAAAGLFPGSVKFDVVGYACTSGTSVIGAEKVGQLVQSTCRTAHVTDPVTALVAACRTLGVSNLALLSPYIADVSQTLRSTLADKGIETPIFGSFDEAEEAKVARISAASVIDAALALCASQRPDALFLSCTNLQTINLIPHLRQKLGIPVLSSNLVLAWHMAQLAETTGPEI